MSDAEFWGRTLLACLMIWCALSILTAAIWAVIAHRPDPWDRLPEQMRAAGDDGWRR
jgi:hypothetical protein